MVVNVSPKARRLTTFAVLAGSLGIAWAALAQERPGGSAVRSFRFLQQRLVAERGGRVRRPSAERGRRTGPRSAECGGNGCHNE